MTRYELTNELLKQLLHYNETSGVFTWIAPRSYRVKAGDVAGFTDPKGYVVINIGRVKYKAHRLAWFYVHGVWPKLELDHKDRIKSNNALLNLVEATRQENRRNQGVSRRSKSGVKGVFWSPAHGKWRASASLNNVTVHIGFFDSIKDAGDAYNRFAVENHGEFAVVVGVEKLAMT